MIKIYNIYRCIFLILFLWSWAVAAQSPAVLINADANMYQVDEKFYRSEQFEVGEFALATKSNIKTVINLRFFTRTTDKIVFKDHPQIKLINIPLLTWRIQAKDIAKVLHSIREHQKNGAVLVHCYHGADRTGIMVAMYRIIYHGWTVEQAKKEMQEGPYGYHSVWKNLDKLLTAETVEKVRKELKNIEKL